MHSLAKIADKINVLASAYRVGTLQEQRKRLGNLSRLPSKVLFDQRTVFEDWGWHYGGRRELQFNIGLEDGIFRYGVAFSLERSQSLPAIDILFPKIYLFNEYLAEYGERYLDLRMSYYVKGEKSESLLPGPIPKEMINEGTFIFLGATQNKDAIDYACVLETLDRLLPLYLYTERDGSLGGSSGVSGTDFFFKSGCSKKLSATGGSQS